MNVIMIVDVVTTVTIAVVIRRVTVVVGGISCCFSAYPASAKLDYTQQLHRHITIAASMHRMVLRMAYIKD